MQERAYAAYREIVAVERDGDRGRFARRDDPRAAAQVIRFDDAILRQSVHNTSISTIETDGETRRLIDTAVTPHLME